MTRVTFFPHETGVYHLKENCGRLGPLWLSFRLHHRLNCSFKTESGWKKTERLGGEFGKKLIIAHDRTCLLQQVYHLHPTFSFAQSAHGVELASLPGRTVNWLCIAELVWPPSQFLLCRWDMRRALIVLVQPGIWVCSLVWAVWLSRSGSMHKPWPVCLPYH